MLQSLSTIDLIVVVLLILFLVIASMYSSFKKKNSEDYFMAGRSLKWYSVAGSIFGTNIHAQQIIGMMGVGYSIGFAQSHYEIWAIPAILVLAYIFIPIYRKKQFFTLSQFLESRYNSQARLAYMILMIVFIMIQLIGGFYIGSRTLGLLFQGTSFEITYLQGIILIASVTALFTVFGGMESVVIADNIQTILMVIAVITVGSLAFLQPEIGSFSNLLTLDHSMPIADQKMHLYLPPNHPKLPVTGIFTGLMVQHFFFWTTNQYQVQRVLAAASDRDARLGAIVAGALKLTIPFFTVAAGTAAFYIFKSRNAAVMPLPDDVYLTLMNAVVTPQYWGLKGIILAGLISAIFASIYSMMNSVSTMISVDMYRKFVNPTAEDKQVVMFGKKSIIVLSVVALFAAYFTFDPSSKDNIFLTMTAMTSYLKPGIVAAFVLGILWKRVHPRTAVAAMLAAPFFGFVAETIYKYAVQNVASPMFGTSLNFMHRVFLTFVFCIILQVVLSKIWKYEGETDADLTIDGTLILKKLMVFFALQIPFLVAVFTNVATPQYLALPAALVAFSQFMFEWYKRKNQDEHKQLLQSDLFYAGILAGVTVWILYFFA